MEKTRYYQIDYAKAIGIFLVIIGHIIFHKEKPDSYLVNIQTFIYSFHIPLFFILSGLGIGLKYQSAYSLLNKKDEVINIFKRLLLPYFIWSLIYIIFSIIFIINASPDLLPKLLFEKFYSTICLYGISPLWFLSNLFISLVIFYSFLFTKFQITYTTISHTIFIIITFILSFYINKLFIPYPFNTNTLYLYPIVTLSRVVPTLFFIEIGAKDMEKNLVCLVRRDTGEKMFIPPNR